MYRAFIICFFVSVGLNAQQVFYKFAEDKEMPSAFPFDTAWCNANSIDSIVTKTYNTKGKKFARYGKGFDKEAYLIKDGLLRDAVSFEDTLYPVKLRKVSIQDLSYLDLKNAEYNPAENSYKLIRYHNNGFSYDKVYMSNGLIKEVVWADGNMTAKGYVYCHSGVVSYKYNSAGQLIAIENRLTNEEEVVIHYRFDYKNGNVYRIYFSIDPLTNEDSVYMAIVTYYSKDKKVKLK